MRLHFTLQKAPISGSLKEACGLPFACAIQPFATPEEPHNSGRVAAGDLARCSSCYAYINRYCHFSLEQWSCALCGMENELSSLKGLRYARGQSRRHLVELQKDLYEADCSPEDVQHSQDAAGKVPGPDQQAHQICIALVDLNCNEEFLELVKSALLAALEAIPQAACFGLVSFSNQVGLYDAQGEEVRIQYVSLLEGDLAGPTALDLMDALPLDSLLAPVLECKDRIAQAIDQLRPDAPPSSEASLDADSATPPQRSRGFGGALQAVLRYIGSSRASQQGTQDKEIPADQDQGFVGAKLMAFLAGPPNKGSGATSRLVQSVDDTLTRNTQGTDAEANMVNGTKAANAAQQDKSNPQLQERLDVSASEFYAEAAAAASALGVSVDVYALSPFRCGLELIEPLAGSTGGSLFLYPDLEAACLPQDVYRRLSTPRALAGLLRVRTSPEFKAGSAHGHLFPDEVYDNLAHVIECEQAATFAFDFEFTRAAGFSEASDDPPFIQVAFQYSTFAPLSAAGKPEQEAMDSPSPKPQSLVLRRLRVLTMPLPVARTARELLDNANAEAILVVLMHKVSQVLKTDSVQEARAMLRKWLTAFCAKHNSVRASQEARTSMKSAEEVDLSLSWTPASQSLPSLVYALLRSPLLAEAPEGHPDAQAAVHSLWRGLPPALLRKAVYPDLMSFTDLETLAVPNHSLSRKTLIAAGAPIFLLDAFSKLLVYYAVGYPPHMPFPPPQNSLLRRTMNAQRQHRRPTPAVQMIRGGVDNVQPFLDCLLEEAVLDERGRTLVPSFEEFLQKLREHVWLHLQGVNAK